MKWRNFNISLIIAGKSGRNGNEETGRYLPSSSEAPFKNFFPASPSSRQEKSAKRLYFSPIILKKQNFMKRLSGRRLK
jgi:hypothetical protein